MDSLRKWLNKPKVGFLQSPTITSDNWIGLKSQNWSNQTKKFQFSISLFVISFVIADDDCACLVACCYRLIVYLFLIK